MNKAVLVDHIHKKTGVPKETIEAVLNAFIEAFSHQLHQHGRIELRRFGVWTTHKAQPRQALDPRNGDTVQVPARTHVRWSASETLLRYLNQED